MIKQHKKKIIITGIVTVLPMLAGLLLWSRMPDQVATHWGADNAANGWSSKPFAVFGLPCLLLAIHMLVMISLLNDPKKQNISPKLLNFIFWVIPITSCLCCITTYLIAVGVKVNIGMYVNAVIGIILIVMGNYLPKSKQSYTVGIRLPWTLNSAENWNRTSRLAGRVFVGGGIIVLINTVFMNSYVIYPVIFILVLIPGIYSFMLYKKGI